MICTLAQAGIQSHARNGNVGILDPRLRREPR